jgi:hypothetical protein
VVDSAALLVTVLALLAAAATLVSTRHWRLALAVGLQLFLAAGLLRLNADREWPAIATAASVVVIRLVVSKELHRSARVIGGSA